MDLIHPATAADVVEIVRDASADGRRLLTVGGRQHIDKGNPSDIDAELWTTQLDRVIAYDPAEMLAVVEAGMRIRDLCAVLNEGRQEWPVDAPGDATVGGVIAAGVSSPRRLRVGVMRDTVVELELVTGDGRLIKSGARTVKNVSGFDVHRLVTGSLGTLGVIVAVALKVRPLPELSVSATVAGDALALGAAIHDALPWAPLAATPQAIEIRLEGWRGEVEQMRTRVSELAEAPVRLDETTAFPARRSVRPVVAEAAVAPSVIGEVVAGSDDWCAFVGVGVVQIGMRDLDELDRLRIRAAELGGIAPVIRGPGGLGDASVPAIEVQRRLKAAFDPAGILAPGRYWGGI